MQIKHISNEWLSTSPRFGKEAKGNSEMAYCDQFRLIIPLFSRGNLTDFLFSRSDVGQIELKYTNEIYRLIETSHLKSSPFPPVPKFNRSL